MVKTDKAAESVTAEFDFGAVSVKAATELPKQSRVDKPNPLAEKVAISVTEGYTPQEFGPIPADMVKTAKNLMHRAAREAGHGLAIRTRSVNGEITLIFQAKEGQKERKYSVADVRKWVESEYSIGDQENAGYFPGKRVPVGVLRAYRTAHQIK